MTRLMTLAVLSLLLAACATATRYQPLGYGGGYSDVRFDANTYKVSFRGNGLTSRDRVETFLMYRLAELTTETGHDYFIIVGSSTDRRQTAVSTPSTFTATTTSMGGVATTTGTQIGGDTIVFTKHQGTAVIKVFKGQRPADNPNAYVAAEVLRYLGPSVRD